MRSEPLSILLFLSLLLGIQVLPVSGWASAGQGFELLRQGRYPEAIEPLRQARKISPLDPDLKRALATACLAAGIEHLGAGRPAEALALLREGKELAPEDGRFSLYLGYLLLKQGDSDEAESLLLEALRQAGPSPEVYRLLAQVCYGAGRLHEALAYLELTVELQPEAEESRKFLDKVRRELQIEEKMGTRHGGNFAISYVEGGERLGTQTLETLQDAFAELGSLFNTFPAQPVPVILYGNRDFSAVTGAPEWAGGAFDGKIRVPVGGLDGMNDHLRRVLYHEYAHVLVFALTRGNLPRWLDEGLAQIAEGEWPPEHLALLRRGGAAADPLPFSRLERSFQGLSGTEAAAAYLQSRDFVRHLLDLYGWPRMLDLLLALGKRENFEQATVRYLLFPGDDLTELQREWLEERR